MKHIEQKVLEFIKLNDFFSKGDKVMVACSGGPDSVFLLHFLDKYKKKYGIELCAVHFNHRLREKESDSDQKFVERLCKSLSIPLIISRLNVKSFAKDNKISIEEAARKLRYSKLETFAGDLDCTKIATAHNMSDNTETILINLFSGTGAAGLNGIPLRRGKIVRPIMCAEKQEITSYLDKEKIRYRIDSSNLKDDYKRNFIRNKILPQVRERLNPSVDEALFRSSKNLEGELHFSMEAVQFFQKKFVHKSGSSVSIKITLTGIFNGEIPGLLLKDILQKYFNHEFERDDYVKINSLIDKQKGRRIGLSKNLFAYREANEIRIERSQPTSNNEIEIMPGSEVKVGAVKIGIEQIDRNGVKFGAGGKVEFVSGEELRGGFWVRPWKAGDKFKPLGMKNFKKVSDFLTDCKVPATQRNNRLVLLNRNHIVWVVGLRIDERFKLNSKTKTVYKLWMN